MLSWAIGFFILALIAAFFGFGGIASSAAGGSRRSGAFPRTTAEPNTTA